MVVVKMLANWVVIKDYRGLSISKDLKADRVVISTYSSVVGRSSKASVEAQRIRRASE